MEQWDKSDELNFGVYQTSGVAVFADGTPTPNAPLNHLAAKRTIPSIVMLREKRVRVEDIRAYFITRDADDNAYLYIDRGTLGSYVTLKYPTIEEATAELVKLDNLFGVIE